MDRILLVSLAQSGGGPTGLIAHGRPAPFLFKITLTVVLEIPIFWTIAR